jgi:cation diffusion facilitator family transporter
MAVLTPLGDGNANREKRLVALSSVIAAIILTGMKIIVGLLTGSLGILSEAAHSGLDLAAAAVTLFAVQVSGRPADREHTYGHGKVENLSALFETALLLVTCVWIIYEAIQRLFFRNVEVQVTIWSFLVMAVSIIIDFSRSRALAKVAKKYQSQALEADALHFSTDIWSSAVVIGGLFLVRAADWFNLPLLSKADAVAAVGVAGIVVYVSLQLGRRTIAGLLDGIPGGMRDEIIRLLAAVPEVEEVERVRVRHSGADAFADVIVKIGRDTALERAHEIARRAETAVRQVMPGADVVVQINPVRSSDEGLLTTVRMLAARHSMGAHGIRVYTARDRRSLELHLEVADSLSVNEAHSQADEFEKELRAALPDLDRIVTHIEPTGDKSVTQRARRVDQAQVSEILTQLPQELGVSFQPHRVTVHHYNGEDSVSFHCVVDAKMAMVDAHALTERIERALRERVPNLGRVVIHVEPPNAVDE